MENTAKKEKPGIAAYLWFVFIILFFSGAFRGANAPFSLLDLSTYQGQFGTIVEGASPGFVGKGGTGLQQQFANILTICGPIMFCMGLLNVAEGYGAMTVCKRLLTPILKPLMGVPGESALVMVANFQSSDTSAAIIKGLLDSNLITPKQQKILLAFAVPGPALLGMYISYGTLLFPYITVSTGLLLIVVFVAKMITGNIMRLMVSGQKLSKSGKKEA